MIFQALVCKPPYITLVWIFLWERGSMGAQGAAAEIRLAFQALVWADIEAAAAVLHTLHPASQSQIT